MDRRQLLCAGLAALLIPRAVAAQPPGNPGGGPGGGPGGDPPPPPAPQRDQPAEAPPREPRENRDRDQVDVPANQAQLPVQALILAQDYQSTPAAALPNARRDAALMFEAFRRLRFEKIMVVADGEADAVVAHVRDFLTGVSEDSIALLYIAGHGLEVDGENLLMLNGGQSFLSLQAMIQTLQQRAGMTILFLDACRTNPLQPSSQDRLARSIAVDGRAPAIETVSLGEVEAAATGFSPRVRAFSLPGTGVKIVFSTDPANVALDGARPSSRNSPFAQALARRLRQRISLDDVIALTTGDVLAATRRRQAPWSQGSVDRPIFLADRRRMADPSAGLR